jgi:hypothetical protein
MNALFPALLEIDVVVKPPSSMSGRMRDDLREPTRRGRRLRRPLGQAEGNLPMVAYILFTRGALKGSRDSHNRT